MSTPDYAGMDMPGDGMNDMTMPMTMMMQMSFYWGKETTILFSGWPDGHFGMYILALFFVFLLAAAVEVLPVFPVVTSRASPMARVLTQAAVYTVKVGLAYLVMLSVMSFNGGVFIVAVFGHGVGYFLVKSQILGAVSGGVGASCTADTADKF